MGCLRRPRTMRREYLIPGTRDETSGARAGQSRLISACLRRENRDQRGTSLHRYHWLFLSTPDACLPVTGGGKPVKRTATFPSLLPRSFPEANFPF